ncbi:hypothetical protein YC2023_039896 [Brassica napus]
MRAISQKLPILVAHPAPTFTVSVSEDNQSIYQPLILTTTTKLSSLPESRSTQQQKNTTKYVRDIRDLEHPYSLEQLSVLSEDSITLDDKLNRVQ